MIAFDISISAVVIGRFVYTYTYAKAIQPHRTYFWMLAILGEFVMIIMAIIMLFKSDDTLVKTSLWAVVMMFLKSFGTAISQGGSRFKAGLRPPED